MRSQRIGGIAAIIEALIYVVLFVYYGAILVYPVADASAVVELGFLSDNLFTLSVLNILGYVVFGIVLAVLVTALHERLQMVAPFFSKLTTVFGLVWVVLVIASGMIANIGLQSVVEIGTQDPEGAMSILSAVNIVVEGLGGGNEIVGGIWVLCCSIIALKGKIFSKAIHYLGVAVGIEGILTLYPLPIFTEIFGLTQILWFMAIGIAMLRYPLAGAKN
ncbi:hypothetical protein [uncultured Croceitalea sp.]|uniref:hypothetical protein n=1 Tax=uncultured Croceitalea sp. TaxID=1798908 RepID=UPI0033068192